MPAGGIGSSELRRVPSEITGDPWDVPEAYGSLSGRVEHRDVVASHALGVVRELGKPGRQLRVSASLLLLCDRRNEMVAGRQGRVRARSRRGDLDAQSDVAGPVERVRLGHAMATQAAGEVDHVLVALRHS